jgi:hypothetical protein
MGVDDGELFRQLDSEVQRERAIAILRELPCAMRCPSFTQLRR